MGLDTFAARSPEGDLTEEDAAAFELVGVDLCGGICSDGSVSFRGKVYDGFISAVTGMSLYQQWIAPEDVAAAAGRLAAVDPETVVDSIDEYMRHPPTPDEVRHLQAFFAICARRGLGLVGWW